jgi:hypothetical protein
VGFVSGLRVGLRVQDFFGVRVWRGLCRVWGYGLGSFLRVCGLGACGRLRIGYASGRQCGFGALLLGVLLGVRVQDWGPNPPAAQKTQPWT